jgi:hypothetical protein
MDINIKDYLSEYEIKEIVREELRKQIKFLLSTEGNSGWTKHSINDWIFKCITTGLMGGLLGVDNDEEIKKLSSEKIKETIKNLGSYEIMPQSYSPPTKLQTKVEGLLVEAAHNNIDIFTSKIKTVIENEEFSEYELGQLVGGIFDRLVGFDKNKID